MLSIAKPVTSSDPPLLSLLGEPGHNYIIQVSTNLASWQELLTVSNATGTVQFTDPGAAGSSRRFYRAVVP